MIVGVTGSQFGASMKQRHDVHMWLLNNPITRLHHGDCIGVDEMCNSVAQRQGIKTTAHPPSNPKKRAFCKSDDILELKPYLERNHDIVDSCDILLVIPHTNVEVLRSGTWATKRYAEKINRPFLIFKR